MTRSGNEVKDKRQDPVQHNQSKPHYPVPASLEPHYTYAHALTQFDPPAGQLPDQLPAPAGFIADLVMHIEPPELHWSQSASHEAKRRYLRSNHNKVFEHVLDNVGVLLEILHYHQAISSEEHGNYIGWLEGTRQAFLDDDAVGYIEMPQWLLHYYDLLRLVQKVAPEQQFRDAENRFCLVLLYPVDDSTSYGMNLNYRWHLPDPANNLMHYNVLCGYRLGRCHNFASGQHLIPAVYLSDKMMITTLYSQFGQSLLDFRRTGLISKVVPQQYV